ncbi:MAG: carbohydrate kinase family protein [Microbacterium gubbeenense]|uniref:carbohydrate kinase family protein n=1 Tax=Microbacterium gubbeenense TaxID=159896 RepID=UPI003F9D9B5C
MTRSELAIRPILVVGDANADLVLGGDVVPRFGQAEQLLDRADLVLGGSASIVACGTARLDAPTSLIARVGRDAFGDVTLAALRTRCVDVTDVIIDDTMATGLSVILSGRDDRAILTALGTIPTLTGTDVTARLDSWQGPPGVLHVASYFLQPALAADLPAVFSHARRRGWTTSLDTNWDPAEQWRGIADVLPHLNVLMPNGSELRALAATLGEAGDCDEDLARGIARHGPRVVVKDGARGGWSIGDGGHVERAPGLPVDVVDTTGAGDSFDAGYLAALAHGVDDESRRLRWAATCGSLSTTQPGGTAAQASLAELMGAMAS